MGARNGKMRKCGGSADDARNGKIQTETTTLGGRSSAVWEDEAFSGHHKKNGAVTRPVLGTRSPPERSLRSVPGATPHPKVAEAGQP